MTRWARSGNTQKHQKMPSDPTPWKDLSAQQGHASSEQKGQRSEKGQFKKRKFKNSQKKRAGKPTTVKAQLMMKNETETSDRVEKSTEDSHPPVESNRNDTMEKSSEEISGRGENSHVKRLQRKPGRKEISDKVKAKLYRKKKAMRKKGMPLETIREIMKDEIRKEVVSMKVQRSTKTCFKCRQVGHILSECPSTAVSSEQGTGICFKCGSTEHRSNKCHLKTQDHPFAQCFICKEQGHLAKDCAKNTHGIYPDGGKCKLCGNVNHLKKDCPSLKKTVDEELIMAHMISEGTSVDAEIVENVEKKKSTKKSKFVKF